MKVGVLALQGDVSEHVQVLADLGADPVELRTPEHLAGIDALILPGSRADVGETAAPVTIDPPLPGA